ncbi:MAG: DUF5686 family protein [Bacteroidales bacterium]
MNRKSLIILMAILFPWMACNAQVLRGTITDEAGMPMPGASVYVTGLRQGTTSNQDGLYEITLPPGTFAVTWQFLGYTPVIRNISVGESDIIADITLTEQLFEIPAVRVSSSGRDPAYFIMRKAIGMAPFHLNEVKMYKAEVYIKGGGKIDKIPKMLKRQMKVEANETPIKEGQYYFMESVNVITFNAPDKYIHQVISSRSNIPASENETSPMDYLEASFYQPVIAEIAISPLSPDAFSHYNFEFLGSTSQGDFVIDKIKVTPKRKSQQLFEGVIYIVEDLWAIHSLDLANENMAGRVNVRQVYMPVEAGIWLPVSLEFRFDLSVVGVKAGASYNSAVKYLEVEPDRSLSPPSGYSAVPANGPVAELKTPTQKEIEKILAKDELTTRDMSRLVKLNETNAARDDDKSLEIKEKTTYIIDKDTLSNDSVYWEKVRPIPLTAEEVTSLPLEGPDSGTLAARDTSKLAIKIGDGSEDQDKKPGIEALKAVISGKRWQASEKTVIEFDGLVSLKAASFNTVDGFVLGTGMTMTTKTGEKGRLTLSPSVKYAFGRERLMWAVNAGILYNPMTSGTIYIRTGSFSKEFSPSGINPVINTFSSLLFRENWMKLYNSTFIIAGHNGELANGLNMNLSVMWEHRQTLENNSDFSLFKPENEYTVNLPENPFVTGDVPGYGTIAPTDHFHASFIAELKYTPRQHYRISNGSKIIAGSDYPTFTLTWKHGYNYNDTMSDQYDLLKADISSRNRFGALSEFNWRLTGGGFINREHLQLQDMYFFNTQESPVLLNSFSDAFYLKPYYSISSPSFFSEAHIRYTTPWLILKRLPGLSRTLMRENIGIASLWTPDYGFYSEIGYSVSEIFLMAELGVYAGFHDLKYNSVGITLRLRFN